jgi:hypothetical protein
MLALPPRECRPSRARREPPSSRDRKKPHELLADMRSRRARQAALLARGLGAAKCAGSQWPWLRHSLRLRLKAQGLNLEMK